MRALLALGANEFNGTLSPRQTLEAAIDEIQAVGFIVEKRSLFYQTPAFPAGAGPDYVNAAIQLIIEKPRGADNIFSQLTKIETAHGRKRVLRWGARTLDIDLLALEDQVLPNREMFLHWANLPLDQAGKLTPETLILPHPRLHQRSFVLVPLMDIAPHWVHPVLGQSVQQMLAALPAKDRASVVALPA